MTIVEMTCSVTAGVDTHADGHVPAVRLCRVAWRGPCHFVGAVAGGPISVDRSRLDCRGAHSRRGGPNVFP